jgi:hypothetical protein
MFSRWFWNWKDSKPHLLLLSNRGAPAKPKYPNWEELWKPVLGESRSNAIQRFVKDGVLGPADPALALGATCTLTELKELLRARKLKVSGKKSQLVARLVGHDRVEMERLTKPHAILVCQGEGVELARAFVEAERKAKEHLEQKLVSLLKTRDFREAADAVARYEATQAFPRGLGATGHAAPTLCSRS